MLHPGRHRRGMSEQNGRQQLFEWLISLRLHDEAQGYTAALVRLGFDDLQSLREDATHDDLRKAGMKEGHIRRALKALDAQPNHTQQRQQRQQRGASSSAGRAAMTNFEIEAVDNSSCGSGSSGSGSGSGGNGAAAARAAAAAAKGGWVVRNPDGSIIFPPGVSCVLCEDDQGRRHRYVVAPSSPSHGQEATSATAASAAAGPRSIRRSVSSGPARGQAGGVGAGGRSAFCPDQMMRSKTPEERRELPWPAHAPQHGGAVSRPSFCWRPANFNGAVCSDGDKSRSPRREDGNGDCGSGCGRCSGGGGGDGGERIAGVSSGQREYQSMPLSTNSARNHAGLTRRGSREESISSRGSGRGRGDFEVDSESPCDSPCTDSGLIHEDYNHCGSSTESSGEMAPLLRVWDNACAAGRDNGARVAAADDFPLRYAGHGLHDHRQQPGARSASCRRLRVDVRVGAAPGRQSPGHKHRRIQQQQPQQHMSVLTGPPQDLGGAVLSRVKPKRRTFCGEIDPPGSTRSTPTNHDTRSASTSLLPRSRFYANGNNAHSMPSVNTAGSGPPGRMEMVPSHVADVLGRGGHVKTIQRIRSTGGINNLGSRNFSCLALADGGDGGCVMSSPLSGNATMAVVAVGRGEVEGKATEDVEEAVDVPEEVVDGSRKPCGGGGGGNRSLVTLDEDSVAPACSAHGRHHEDWGVSCATTEDVSRSGGDGGGGGDDDISCGGLSGLSLDLGNLQDQGFGVPLSYDLSESGTLTMKGFLIKADGIKSTPTPNYIGLNDSSRNSAPKSCYEERMNALRPASLQITSGSHGRSTPCSRNSSFGRAGGGGSGGGSGGSGGSRASRSGGGGGTLVPLPPPPPLTSTPRTREKYILLDEIGRGGGGTVHKAIHVPSMRLVAVKMVQVHDDEKRRQMYKELKTLLSMKPVPLPSPSVVGGSSTTSTAASGLPTSGWGEHCGDGSDSNSGTGSSCGGSQDGGSPKPGSDARAAGGGGAESEAGKAADCRGGEGYNSSGSEGAGGTRTTTGLSSRGTLSSRGDGTPSFPSQQHQPPTPTTASTQPTKTGSEGGHHQRHRRHHHRREADHGGSGGGGGGAAGVADLYLPVVTFHDAYMDKERGLVCVVMEYMDGGTLQKFVSDEQALSEPALAGVARSVLRGLAEMHAQRKIHRDIKPSNILLDRQGRVKISDFGLVRELTKTGSFAKTFTGTVTYMSPERIEDSGHGFPSDIWSLGMVTAALALGQFPLSTSNTSTDHMFEMIQAITEDPIPALSPQLFSPELCDFVELMLRRDPAERPCAKKLLQHPFLQLHQGCDDLVDMVQVAPATRPEVQNLMKKVVDYHLAAAVVGDKSCIEKEVSASFFGKDTWGGFSPQPALLPPYLRKKDVEVLASQLQVTRTELVREYEKIRRNAEWNLWGDNPPPQSCSRSSWRRGSGSGSGSGAGIDNPPATPGSFHSHSALRHGHGRQLSAFLSSSPGSGSLDLLPNGPTRGGGGGAGGCETPQTAGSAFSAAAPRPRRREGGTPAGRSSAQRRSSPSCRAVPGATRDPPPGRSTA